MADSPSLKEKLASGQCVFGPWCTIPSPTTINIIATAGFDFVIIDMEHSPIGFERAEEMVRAAQSENVPAIIRLGGISEIDVLKALDIGSDGVLVAHVESVSDARRVASLARYHPQGARGFSPFTRAGKYSGGDVTRHADNQNRRTLVGVILEGNAGISAVGDIAAEVDVDLIYIGAYDLSQALGMPGQVTHPEVKARMESCAAAIRAAGRAPGGYVAKTTEDIAWMKRIGLQFITWMPDCVMFHDACRRAVDQYLATDNDTASLRPSRPTP